MRVISKIVLGLSLVSAPTIAVAATLIPVTPFPGSTLTSVSGINDSNQISGEYTTSDGIEHAFFGPLA